MLTPAMHERLGKDIRSRSGLDIHLYQEMPTSPDDRYAFSLKIPLVMDYRKSSDSHSHAIQIMEQYEEQIMQKIIKGTDIGSMLLAHDKEIKKLQDKIKGLEEYKVFYDKFKALGMNLAVSALVPDVTVITPMFENALTLKVDADHGDEKTRSVFPERWPTIKAGTVVEGLGTFFNFYGAFVRVKYNGQEYDIDEDSFIKEDLKTIELLPDV